MSTDLPLFDFKGKTFDKAKDGQRLQRQKDIVLEAFRTGQKFTLSELSARTGQPAASVSARYRDLNRQGYPMKKKNIGRGVWLYWLEISQ